MTFILVAEKPSHAFDAVRQFSGSGGLFPSDPFPVIYVNSFFGMAMQFAWPRSVRWADLPVIRDPEFQHVRASEQVISPFLINPKSGRVVDEIRCDIDDRIAKAEQILVTTIDHHSEIHAVDNFLRSALNERYAEVRIDWTSAYTPNAPVIPWKEMLDRHLDRSFIMKRFLFNYSINATMLFGRVYEESGLGSASESVVKSTMGSASALQYLYHLRRSGHAAPHEAMNTMENWQGTGRYPNQYGGLSTARSRHLVISNLVGSGLVSNIVSKHIGGDPEKFLGITKGGLRFLDAIHPASEDPDQIFRLKEWSALPLNEAERKVDRYLSTYFGRQKSGKFALAQRSEPVSPTISKIVSVG